VLGGTPTYWTRTPDGGLVGQRRTTRRYYVQDALGSTVALLDSAGAIKQRYTYEPYGKLTNTPTATNPFRYAGGYTTQASGSTLYHFAARHYDPALGRWTQTDPLDQPDDLRQANRYGYAGGDPVNFTDRLGLATEFCGTKTIDGNTPNCDIDTDQSDEIRRLKFAFNVIKCGVKLVRSRGGDVSSCQSF